MTFEIVSPRILVTGVAGYIGSHTALACCDAGWQVTGLDDLSTGSRSAVAPGVRFHRMDCADPAVVDLCQAERIDAAIHFAGRISVEESMRDPLGYFVGNVSAATRFFQSLSSAGVRALVFSSTAAVYGDAGRAVVDETAPTRPISPYGQSKLMVEEILQSCTGTVPYSHVVLRYFNVAGADTGLRAGPRKDAGHLISRVAKAATGQAHAITINGTDYDTPDGTCLRDFIHVSDLATVHLAAIQYLLAGGESATFNCGYGHGYSVREVVDRALRLAKRPFEVQIGSRRPGDIPALVALTDALRSTLDWEPTHDSLDGILQNAIDWETHCLRAAAERPQEARE